ncbi:unnamed protein product [Somion occarium]|uniref:Ubiquitin carboxyl-terminal hydrolase n=1 Tax=Somion occarium TaxID=3059160 RepID=A0ABP1E418_9APHY
MSEPAPGATRWIPLESNPDVLNSWCSKAGLITSEFEYSDIYGLDEDLLALVPQPVKAVILLLPLTDAIERKTQEEIAKIRREGQHHVDSSIIWIKQTTNVPVIPDSPIAKFIIECRTLTPEARSHLLETTTLFSEIHSEVASAGQTAAPDANAKVDLHFTCFVKAPDPANPSVRRLIELDGRRDGPLDRGLCTDLLKDVARVVKEHYVDTAASVQFSMLALAPPPEF